VRLVKVTPGRLERALEWSVVMIGLLWLFVYAWTRWVFSPRPHRVRA
jgi:hypothetical protein